MKHDFIQHWRAARQALKQRNQLLRLSVGPQELAPWSQALAQHAEAMHIQRGNYFDTLQSYVSPLINDFLGEELAGRFHMEYLAGWDTDAPLEPQLARSIPRDRQYGHTTLGPHRAELKLRMGGQDAAAVLSRGQMKLLICALRLGQAAMLNNLMGIDCVLLIDDLPAELDAGNRARIGRTLSTLRLQTFLSAIEAEALLPALGAENEEMATPQGMFHVKRGKISAQN